MSLSKLSFAALALGCLMSMQSVAHDNRLQAVDGFGDMPREEQIQLQAEFDAMSAGEKDGFLELTKLDGSTSDTICGFCTTTMDMAGKTGQCDYRVAKGARCARDIVSDVKIIVSGDYGKVKSYVNAHCPTFCTDAQAGKYCGYAATAEGIVGKLSSKAENGIKNVRTTVGKACNSVCSQSVSACAA